MKLGVSKELTIQHLEALQRYHGKKGNCYFSLIHKGVKFNQHVGVIQVGNLTIEVLPKTDGGNQNYWREILIGMLRSVGTLKVGQAGTSHLKIRSNSILDLCFELFITELESLLHQGLTKQYRRIEENSTSLKGKLKFAQQLNYNLIHKERFFVNHQTYDGNHIYNQILFAALELTRSICNAPLLSSRIGAVNLAFPSVDKIKVKELTFSRLKFDRKSESYQQAIDIARMLLLNYHPDISSGNCNVLALMFDMNVLWESFILSSLKRYAINGTLALGKVRKSFWKPENGSKASIEPDIVLKKGDQTIIFDTKWKIIKNNRPSDDDLKQMYVYTNYYQSIHTALVYPATGNSSIRGNFYHELNGKLDKPCSIIRIPLPDETNQIRQWQREISNTLFNV
ncbi:McrC family protein [Sunxiuqinia rutila]|uniref:McrC family protein n=1 Tax=Sunxiuqinia rutila TaxID=1397841 RepID=UPI003D36E666